MVAQELLDRGMLEEMSQMDGVQVLLEAEATLDQDTHQVTQLMVMTAAMELL